MEDKELARHWLMILYQKAQAANPKTNPPNANTKDNSKGRDAMQTRTIQLPSGQPARTNRKEGMAKRLSESEFLARREKSLRFCCDEKFTKGHKCKQKELNVMSVHDNEDEEDEEVEVAVEEIVAMQTCEAVELEFGSGFYNPRNN